MVGIKPIGNATQWTAEEKDQIYDEIDLKYGNDLYLHTITENKSCESPANIMRYDIVLLAVQDNKQYCVNDFLVSLKLAEYDAETKHRLEKIPNIVEDIDSDSSDSDWEKEIDVERKNDWPNSRPKTEHEQCENDNKDNDFDFDFENAYVNFEEDDLLEMFPGFVQRKASSTPNATLEKIDEDVNEADVDPIENNDLSLAERVNQTDNGYASVEMDDSTDASSEYDDVNHQVEYIYKRPKVHWWQTEELLILRIAAHDNVQYGLEITSDYLIYS